MLEIQLRIDQISFANEIAQVFPDLRMTVKASSGNEYQAALKDGREGLEQLRFLRQHGIGYIDLEARRERLVREFFTDVVIAGNRVSAVHLQRVAGKPEEHCAEVVTARRTLTLHLPAQWNPPMLDVAHEFNDWVCVYQHGGSICAALASRDGSAEDEAVFLKARALEEVEAWLQEQQFVPVIRLPRALGVFALYQPLRETKWGAAQ